MRKLIAFIITLSCLVSNLFLPSTYALNSSINTEFVIAYNDFENTGSFSKNGFTIADSGDEAHGKVFVIPAYTGDRVPTPDIYNVTYQWNQTTLNVFHEEVTTGVDYIVKYDYWCDPNHTGVFSGSGPFSFAPSHKQFFTNDHRHYPKYYSDGQWHKDSMSFTAGVGDVSTSTTAEGYINMKPHTIRSNVKSYIDNYCVAIAGEFRINSSVSVDILSDNVIMADSVNSYNNKNAFALGDVIKFKVNSSPALKVSVTMGNSLINADSDGIYTVTATDDIEINATVDNNIIENNFLVIEDEIYLQNIVTVESFFNSLGVDENFIELRRHGEVIPNDFYISINDTISYTDDNSKQYNVNIIGDIAAGGDGLLNVTDMLALLDIIYGEAQSELPTFMFDLNESGSVTVTDVVHLRGKIMSAPCLDKKANSSVINKMNAFVDDILARSGTGATRTEINNSLYKNNNRGRIANVIRKAMNGEDITIVYFGGSITEGSGGSSAAPFSTNITETGGYVAWVTKWFRTFFPNINVTVYNAGIGSTDTPIAIHRMVEDVLAHKPDFVINEWACNDAARYPYKVGTYEAVLRRLYENDIAVLLYGFATKDGAGSQELHKPVADFYNTPFVSYYDAFKLNSKWTQLTNDGTHPNIVGHSLAGATIANFLQSVYENIDKITVSEAPIPREYFHNEAAYYEGAYLANFKDIYEGKIAGIRIKSLGDFRISSTPFKKGCRTFYPCSADYSADGVYNPMVIEIDSCKTLFLLAKLINTSTNPDGAYYVKINGNTVGNYTTSDGHSSTGYCWATTRCFYNSSSPKVTVEIYPNISKSGGHVDLLSLLIS